MLILNAINLHKLVLLLGFLFLCWFFLHCQICVMNDYSHHFLLSEGAWWWECYQLPCRMKMLNHFQNKTFLSCQRSVLKNEFQVIRGELHPSQLILYPMNRLELGIFEPNRVKKSHMAIISTISIYVIANLLWNHN